MKIGMFTDAFFPIISGVSVSINNLRRELEAKGHEVTIVTFYHPNGKVEDGVVRVKGRRLPMKGLGEYNIAKVTRKLVNQMAKYDFDIIHCQTEFTIGRLGRRVAKKLNVPMIHTYHTMYEDYCHFVSKIFEKPLSMISKFYSKRFANSADVVIFPTIKVKNVFDGYGYKRQSHIIPTGIYLDKFAKSNFSESELDEYRNKLNITKDNFSLMFLGRMSREKVLNH